MASGRLYVWARRMNFIKVRGKTIISPDHTWVTDYPNPGPPNGFTEPIPADDHYWFCWGVFHSGGDTNENPKPYQPFFSPVNAGVTQAVCICEANVQDDAGNPSWPHAQIPGIYGEHGVCHQVANRILWSAGLKNGKRVTVRGVRGWQLSWFLYGPYGSAGTWPLPKCPPSDSLGPTPEAISSLAKSARKNLKKNLDPSKQKDLQQLQKEMLDKKQALAAAPLAGAADQVKFAGQVNRLLAATLKEARSSILNKVEFKAVFGFDLEKNSPRVADLKMAKLYAVTQKAMPTRARVARTGR